ncbi:hypothetical protein P4129_21180 [Pseudomonas aeruginosa]|nr:hypothetical protein [Pseudomonas aeruginosa]
MTNTDLKPLLDNLRNATEFFNSADGDLASICNGTKQIAAEWLENCRARPRRRPDRPAQSCRGRP